MAKYLYSLLVVASLVVSSYGFGINYDDAEADDADEEEGRLIIGATGNVGFNATQLAAIVGLLATALLPLLALSLLCCAGVAYLLFFNDKKEDEGYGHSTYRSLGLGDINWEKFSILDWISMGEETFRKLDPADTSCHQRVICEVHQNTQKFGTLANKFVNLFGYLKFVELFNLPGSVKKLTEDYLEAADRGRTLKVDCGQLYPECEFSIKSFYDRYHGNEI